MNLNKKTFSLTILAALSLAACGGSDNMSQTSGASMAQASSTAATRTAAEEESTASEGATQFVMDAFQSGLNEIQLSQLALQKSGNDKVRKFAQRMIDDHTRLNNGLQQLAQNLNFAVPAEISADQKAQADQLATLSGDAFDRAYMTLNVNAHQTDLAAAKLQAQPLQQGSNDVVSLAADASVPVLEVHLALAREVSSLLDPAVFVTTLFQSGLAEIRWSELALQKASDSRVKDFAQQMIDEHRQANDRLTTLAQQNGVQLPTALTPDQQAEADQLALFAGADFDKTYMDLNVVAHLKAGRLAKQQAEQGSLTEARALAAAVLPTLGSHLLKAIDIDQQIQPSFLYKAYQDGKAELQLAQLALTQASNAQVKTFAQQMITDHISANAETATLAQQKNLVVPAAISPQQLRDFVALMDQSGAEFDRNYMDINIKNHRSAIADATEQSQNATDADIKALADKMLPVLNAHLTMATDIRQALPAS